MPHSEALAAARPPQDLTTRFGLASVSGACPAHRWKQVGERLDWLAFALAMPEDALGGDRLHLLVASGAGTDYDPDAACLRYDPQQGGVSVLAHAYGRFLAQRFADLRAPLLDTLVAQHVQASETARQAALARMTQRTLATLPTDLRQIVQASMEMPTDLPPYARLATVWSRQSNALLPLELRVLAHWESCQRQSPPIPAPDVLIADAIEDFVTGRLGQTDTALRHPWAGQDLPRPQHSPVRQQVARWLAYALDSSRPQARCRP